VHDTGSVTGTPSTPLFGGFMSATSSASAWSAPTTAGGFGCGVVGFGSGSSFTPKPAEQKEDNEEVSFLDL
jgi:hypothetical protein